eukprot:GHVU01093478.1.p2 GENE.GHVU01093478.1~~GHVU01093478.1.p2  ORF type:complete len:226 (-),score=28.34 GHVU01093478.1:365-1042(-)
MERYATATLMTPGCRDDRRCWPAIPVEGEDGDETTLTREWAMSAMERYVRLYENYKKAVIPVPTALAATSSDSARADTTDAVHAHGTMDWSLPSPFASVLMRDERQTLGDRLGRVREVPPDASEASEMSAYMAESIPNGRLGLDEKRDVLKYWFDRREGKPTLSCIAREIFAGPPTTAGVERIFSLVGRYRGKLQRMMNESTLQMYTCVAVNYKFIELCRKLGLA